MKRLAIITLLVMALIAANAFAASMSDVMPVLKAAKKSVDSTLSEIDKDMKSAAKDLSTVDLKSDDARKVLTDLMKFRPYVVDCSILDANGTKITVEPAEYRKLEGTSRSDLPHVITLLKTKKPVMSDVYRASEGTHAITIGCPILTDKGELKGAVRMLIRYEVFLGPLVSGKPFNIWVMQPNGVIVYDPNPDEIGRNIFSDDMYKPFPDLVSFAQTVAMATNGAGSYNFYANAPKDMTLVQKVAVWDTAGVYGTEWRIIAMEEDRVIEQPAKNASGDRSAATQVK